MAAQPYDTAQMAYSKTPLGILSLSLTFEAKPENIIEVITILEIISTSFSFYISQYRHFRNKTLGISGQQIQTAHKTKTDSRYTLIEVGNSN